MNDTNNDTPKEKWPDELKAAFSRYTAEHEQNAWVGFVREAVGKASDSEMCSAIRAAKHNHWSDKSGLNITVAELVTWIRLYREGQDTKDSHQKKTTAMSRLMERIYENQDDRDTVWEIICEPREGSDCEALERYAMRIIPGWKRPKSASTIQEIQQKSTDKRLCGVTKAGWDKFNEARQRRNEMSRIPVP